MLVWRVNHTLWCSEDDDFDSENISDEEDPASVRSAPDILTSSLDRIFEYPHGLPNSHYFPFDSLEDFMLYAWDGGVGARTPTSCRRFDLLMKVITDPRFDSRKIKRCSGETFRRTYDARMPLLEKNYVTVTKTKRYRKSQKQMMTRVRQPYFSIDDYASRVMNDPFWSSVMKFGDDYDEKQIVRQWNQTPVHHEFFKWSKHMMLERSDQQPVCIGDFVQVAGENWEGHIYRVEKFLHRPGCINRSDEESAEWWPTDVVQLRTFEVNGLEAIRTNEVTRIDFECVTEVVQVSSGSSSREGCSYYCHRHRDGNGHLSSFQLTHPVFQYQAVLDNQPFLFFTVFIDAYTRSTSSVTGIYLQWTTTDTKFENIGDGIKTLSLCPKGLDLVEVMHEILNCKLAHGGIDVYFASEDRKVHLEGMSRSLS